MKLTFFYTKVSKTYFMVNRVVHSFGEVFGMFNGYTKL